MFKYGSELIRFDCHLHTNADKEFKCDLEEEEYITGYVNKLNTEEIGVGVITNHNKFNQSEFKKIYGLAKKKGILLLPGVELSVKEGKHGIHTLIVFDPKDWVDSTESINHLLHSSFMNVTPNRENQNAKCEWDLNNLFAELDKYKKDYFIIFAHVDDKSGLFNECDGGVLSTLSKNPHFSHRVLGLQKSNSHDNYRLGSQHMGNNLPRLEGSDPSSIDKIGKGKNKTYLKLGNLSYQSVKYALVNHQNRVQKRKPSQSHGYIKSVEFFGGNFDNKTINLNQELNCFVGIRGSGKSSVLEGIRYGLNQNSREDQDYKESLISHTLGSGGLVKATIVDCKGEHFIVERILGNEFTIKDLNGQVKNVSISTLLRNPLYFGQKDLSMMKLGFEDELIDTLIGDKNEKSNRELAEINIDICQSIRNFLRLKSIPDKIEELNLSKENSHHKIQEYVKREVGQKLEKITSFDSDKRELEKVFKELTTLKTKAEKMNFEEVIEKIEKFTEYNSVYNEEIFEDARRIVTELSDQVKKILSSLKYMESLKKDFGEKISQVKKNQEDLSQDFAAIKRELQSEKLNADFYLIHSENIETCKSEIERLEIELNKKDSFKKELKDLFKKRKEKINGQNRIYSNVITKINGSQHEISIELQLNGNKNRFKESLVKNLRGTGIRGIRCEKLSNSFIDYAELIEDCILNEGEKLFSVLNWQEASKVQEIILKKFDSLITINTPNKVEINYHGKPLSSHSAGQRASALILLIMSQQDNDVIIIDQPEDDMDNQVIYHEIVKEIKKNKHKIQFIFATHNANIPVLGDAERIVRLNRSEGKYDMEFGTIDDPKIQKTIVDIMEGGTEAFDKRNSIYSNWKIN